MAFTQARARGTLELYPAHSYRPHYRLNFDPESHYLFSSEVVALDTQKRYYASVSIPKAIFPDDLPLDRPVQVKGPLTVHLLAEDTLEWQLDVDWISSGGMASLVGHLHAELVFEPETDPIVKAERHEAWIVDQLLPVKRQLWLNRHPVDVLSGEGLYRWFAVFGYWSVKDLTQVHQPGAIATLCFSEGIPMQKLCTLLINRRGSCSSRSVIRFPPHAALDIDRAVLETQTQATQLATHLNVVPDLVVKNGDVVAHPLSPRDSVETSAGLVLPAINPEGTARRRVSRGRSAPHRATNREVRDLRLQTLKVKRALKQLGAEHMLEHFTALLNTTKPGSTTRSRHRTQVEFSAGPLVGTRARRREGSTAD